jgi:tRNA modification GTPase
MSDCDYVHWHPAPINQQRYSVSLTYEADTIAAIATPVGEGGISVIRISGEEALKVADRGFSGPSRLPEVASHTAHYGAFSDDSGIPIDNVVAILFKKPHSYTGEDTVELSCHGGQFLTQRILEAVIRFGARAAQPGEFTKRAFLNGRMDLAQAEAVADLIHSRSERARQVSLSQLGGELSKTIVEVRDQLISCIGLLELELDFAEEGYEFTEKGRVAGLLQSAIARIDELLSSYKVGRIYKDGVRVALAGPPNVGKSSLLNALLREERAIVTSIPGTTRDIIEESVTLGGILFSLSDTAGLREAMDPVEREGVRRAEERLLNCDILLLLLDCSRSPSMEESQSVQRLVLGAEAKGASCIVLMNKIDLAEVNRVRYADLSEIIETHKVLQVSAKTLRGLDTVKDALVEIALGGSVSPSESGITITSARHFSALGRAKESLRLALESISTRKSGEFVAVDLRGGLDALGEIVGTVTTEDILNSIFSSFCVGK